MTQLSGYRTQPIGKSAHYPAATAARAAQWLIAHVAQRDLLVVLCFCATGLVLTIAALSEFADFSSLLEEIDRLY